MHSAPVFLKSVPIVTTSRKSAKLMTAHSEEEPITMSFTVEGEEAEPGSIGGSGGVGGWFLVGSDGWYSCPNSSISTKDFSPENGVPS